MRALIQRVSSAQVSTEQEPARSIDRGYVILLGIGPNDTEEIAQAMWAKISKLRIFEDEQGKTNLSLLDVQGSVLLVSQFTLYADCKRGNRPSFTRGAAPQQAEALYEYFGTLIENNGVPVRTGWFGAYMNVDLTNDGPFTIWLDSDELFPHLSE